MVSKAGRSSPPKDFESALSELEALVAGMEAGQLSLEQSLAAYKRGMELVAYCQNTLGTAEQQVRILDDGLLKDYHPAEPSEEVPTGHETER
ncbi:MAG: exodeoxyribonuclease VII small subunit [Thiobacillaceae bacterium]|jgi:exodeoxyribonuclease VII small subunit|nr:exodeoxyribonuclease VII small subunit [Thiobacillaceae bacterium]